MTSGATIRRALPQDAPALAALKRLTFRETFVEDFAIPYPPDDLAAFEADCFGEDTVAAELADPARETWLAAHDGALLGFAQLGPAKLPHSDVAPRDGELYQLYLRRSAQGLGHGRALLDQVLVRIAAVYPGAVWLGVWPGNGRAQAVYRRHGFVRVGGYRFPVGRWMDDEFIFRRPAAQA